MSQSRPTAWMRKMSSRSIVGRSGRASTSLEMRMHSSRGTNVGGRAPGRRAGGARREAFLAGALLAGLARALRAAAGFRAGALAGRAGWVGRSMMSSALAVEDFLDALDHRGRRFVDLVQDRLDVGAADRLEVELAALGVGLELAI